MRVTYLWRTERAANCEVPKTTERRNHADQCYTREHADLTLLSGARRLRVDVLLQPVADGDVQAGIVHGVQSRRPSKAKKGVGLVAADDAPDVREARRREARDHARQGPPLLGGPPCFGAAPAGSL